MEHEATKRASLEVAVAFAINSQGTLLNFRRLIRGAGREKERFSWEEESTCGNGEENGEQRQAVIVLRRERERENMETNHQKEGWHR